MRVVYSIGRYQNQARLICDAVIDELRRRGWLAGVRRHDEPDESIADCDLFHGHSVLSLGTLRHLRATRPDVRIVLQRDSAHIACTAYLDEIRKRQGGPYDALCAMTPNVRPDKIPEQTEEYELADFVLVPSTYARDTFVAAGYPPERLKIIPLTAGADLFRPAAEPAPFRVVLGGRATLTKGYPYAMDACRLIGEPLDILEGYPLAEMGEQLGRRTVCLAPSITDGMNHQVLAAMACGLVPIVSTTTGCRDLIQHGVNGFVYDLAEPDVVPRIASTLSRLRGRPEEMRAIGRRARETVAGRSWQDYGREVCDWYESLVAAGLNPSPLPASPGR